MTASSSLDPSLPSLIFASLATLTAIFSCGWLLIPRHFGREDKLARAALLGASGMLFISSVIASIALHRMNYLALIPIVQIGFRFWSLWQSRRATPAASPRPTDQWTRSEIMSLIGIGVVAVALFQIPLQRTLLDNTTREVHSDLGYYAQQVLSIEQAGVADLWSPVLGSASQEAGITQDLWYHWGAIFLAIGIKNVFAIPAISALLDVTGSVMHFLLLLGASAIASRLIKGKTASMLWVGALSLIATQIIRSLELQQWLNAHFPYGTTQHSRFALAAYFSYKFEAVALLAAIGAWLQRWHVAAMVILFCACVSAPHTVAACGIAGGATLVIGLLLRHPNMWKTGAALVAIPSFAWFVTVRVMGASMAGQRASILPTDPSTIGTIFLHSSVDILISLGVCALSLPGILHLIRSKDESDTEEARTLGWMALVSIASACITFHLLQKMTDRHHITLFIQAVLVMPTGIWGAARLFTRSSRGLRSMCLAVITASCLMGAHDLLLPFLSRTDTTWVSSDLQKAKEILNGAPVGYIATQDRGWWIPQRGVMSSIIGSRIIRLNPLKSEQDIASSVFYGYHKPFTLVKPIPQENVNAWTLRFAQKLGIQYLIEFPSQPLPPPILEWTKRVVSTPSFSIYTLQHQPVVAQPNAN